MLSGRDGRVAVWLQWERGWVFEAGAYAEWPRRACRCAAEVGEWMCARSGRVAVQLSWVLQWLVEGQERFTLEVKHPVTESLGWKNSGT